MNGVPRRVWIPAAVSIPVSFLAAFFVAFNAVFSDAFGTSAYVGLMLYVTAAYGVLGLLLAVAWPDWGWRWTFWLLWPATVLLGVYSVAEPGCIGWHVVVLALAALGGALGGVAGAGLRHGHRNGNRIAA